MTYCDMQSPGYGPSSGDSYGSTSGGGYGAGDSYGGGSSADSGGGYSSSDDGAADGYGSPSCADPSGDATYGCDASSAYGGCAADMSACGMSTPYAPSGAPYSPKMKVKPALVCKVGVGGVQGCRGGIAAGGVREAGVRLAAGRWLDCKAGHPCGQKVFFQLPYLPAAPAPPSNHHVSRSSLRSRSAAQCEPGRQGRAAPARLAVHHACLLLHVCMPRVRPGPRCPGLPHPAPPCPPRPPPTQALLHEELLAQDVVRRQGGRQAVPTAPASSRPAAGWVCRPCAAAATRRARSRPAALLLRAPAGPPCNPRPFTSKPPLTPPTPPTAAPAGV